MGTPEACNGPGGMGPQQRWLDPLPLDAAPGPNPMASLARSQRPGPEQGLAERKTPDKGGAPKMDRLLNALLAAS